MLQLCIFQFSENFKENCDNFDKRCQPIKQETWKFEPWIRRKFYIVENGFYYFIINSFV